MLSRLFAVKTPRRVFVPQRFTGGKVQYYGSSGSNVSRRQLERLESKANENPSDVYIQEQFMRALASTYPQMAVRRFESGRFADSTAIRHEYQKALASVNQQQSHTHMQQGYNGMHHQNMGQSQYGGYAAAASGYDASGMAQQGFGAAAPAGWQQWNGAQAGGLSGSEFAPVHVQVVEPSARSQLWKAARMAVAALAVVGIASLALDEARGGGPRGIGLNKEIQPDAKSNKCFDDVKGVDEAKEELEEIVQYLREPESFTRLGGKLPKGVLLTGPPGTGKTLLAKAIAGEAKVPFFYAAGSEFEEMYVGVGARRVRDLFAAARKRSPCIIFIDEIDAIGSTRALKEQSSMKATLNQLLVELDGFREAEGVIIIAATNFPDALDPALVRPGRFDRNVSVPLPDLKGRRDILSLYLKPVPLAEDVDANVIARGTPGASGAELANLVNIAAIRASVRGAETVTHADLEFAKDKVLMGNERKSAIIPEHVRKVTAWHEGGHALVALKTQGAMPIHKATIMPRGQALGMVHQLPEEQDLMQRSKLQMRAEIDVCMGGRVAEEIFLGADHVTSGASSDIQRANEIARRMVSMYGMGDSKSIGMMYIPSSGGGRESVSDETKQAIDAEVRRLLQESYDRAFQLLKSHRRELNYLATALLEHETLTSDEIKQVVKGKTLQKAD